MTPVNPEIRADGPADVRYSPAQVVDVDPLLEESAIRPTASTWFAVNIRPIVLPVRREGRIPRFFVLAPVQGV